MSKWTLLLNTQNSGFCQAGSSCIATLHLVSLLLYVESITSMQGIASASPHGFHRLNYKDKMLEDYEQAAVETGAEKSLRRGSEIRTLC